MTKNYIDRDRLVKELEDSQARILKTKGQDPVAGLALTLVIRHCIAVILDQPTISKEEE